MRANVAGGGTAHSRRDGYISERAVDIGSQLEARERAVEAASDPAPPSPAPSEGRFRGREDFPWNGLCEVAAWPVIGHGAGALRYILPVS